LSLTGIAGDRHAGATRPSEARAPWHDRGTPIANTRHLPFVSVEECADVATLLGIPELDPALFAPICCSEAVPSSAFYTPGTQLQFPSGATILVTEQNASCIYPGRELAEVYGNPRLAALFPKVAIGRPGLVELMEWEGVVKIGAAVRAIAPPGTVTRRQDVLRLTT
jgi:hypothetical protein